LTDHREDDSSGSGWVRVVRDADGRAWRLREIFAASTVAPARATALLANDGTVLRRITAYPADWHERPAAELLALVHAAAKLASLKPSRSIGTDLPPPEGEAGPSRG
jgi:hypothetical protein